MISFAAKATNGQEVLGIGLSNVDLMRLKSGQPVSLNLASVHVGFWKKGADGKRSFQQPRDSHIVILPGDQPEDIGEFLGVKMPSIAEIRRRTGRDEDEA